MDVVEKILEKLSPEQREAVTANGPAHRVIACAGAGKTEVMARRVLYVVHRGAPPDEVVAFTFTDRAAGEMKARILRRAEQILGEAARDAMGNLSVGTIHSYCLRLLQERGAYGNFDMLDEHQENAFLARHGWRLGFKELGAELLGEDVPYHEAIALFRSSASVVYSELIDRNRLRAKSPGFAAHLDDYERLLEDHRLLTFDRVVSKAVALLRSDPAARPAIRHLLVDEYQDVNTAQVELVSLLAGPGTSVLVVGDSNQSIYEWRGSRVECFDQFGRRFAQSKDHALVENRRSRDGIIDAANAFGAAMNPRWSNMKGIRNDRPPAVWLTPFDTEEDEADWVVEKIKRLHKEGRPYRDMAILLGSVDTAGAPYIDRLREAGIRFEVGGRSGLFRHDAAQALGRIFAWFADHDWRPDTWDRSQDLEGDALLESALVDCLGRSETEAERLARELRRVRKAALDDGYENFVELYQDLLVALGVRDLDPKDEDDATLLALWGRFNQLLNDYEAIIRRVSADPERGRGSRKLDWPRALDGFAWYLALYAAGSYEESTGEDAAGVDAVRITTIHQSKGLEWPVVFLPSLLNRRFPTRNRSRAARWLLDTSLFDAGRYAGDENARRRVLYVGITRARDGLFASWFTSGNGKRSRFLDQVVAALNPPAATLQTPVPTDPNRRAAERELRVFTPTELIHYRRCPYRYRLSHLWGYQVGLAPELGFGRAQHHVLRGLAQKAADGTRITEALVRRELDRAFYLPYAPAGMREDMKKNAAPKLIAYATSRAADLARTVDAEAKMEFSLGNAIVAGMADVIHGDADEEEVRDYKSGEDELTMPEADFQVQLYGAGLRRAGRPIKRGSVANLETNEVRPVDVSMAALSKAEREAEETIGAILEGKFPAKPGGICESCDFARVCRFAKVPL